MPTPRRYENHAQRQAAYRKRIAEAWKEPAAPGKLPRVPPIPTIPGQRRWKVLTQQALRALNTVKEEMENYYDLRSETWQTSERGEAFADNLQALEQAADALENLTTPA